MSANDSFKIRPVVNTDLEALTRLFKDLGYPTTREAVGCRISLFKGKRNYLTAVAEESGVVVGLIGACWGNYLEHDGRWGQVTALVVAHHHRGRGIGGRLLYHAESWFRRHGAVACIIHSHLSREKAHRFYGTKGYLVNGVRMVKSFYPEKQTALSPIMPPESD